MGYAVDNRKPCCTASPHLGQSTAQTAGSVVGGGLIQAAPFTGPAAPFVAGAGAIVGFLSNMFKFGYDPQKLGDTALTEDAQAKMNQAWHALTGEALNGVTRTAEPGKYGDAGIAIFSPSAYPNVPKGPAGDPAIPVDLLVTNMRAYLDKARSGLQRPESAAGFDANAKRMLGLMQRVKEARAALGPIAAARAAAEGTIPRTPTGELDVAKILPWALGAFAAYTFIA